MTIDWLEIHAGKPVNVEVALVLTDSARFAQVGREVDLITVLLEYAKWVQVPVACLQEAGLPGKVRYYIEGKEDPVQVEGKSVMNKSLVIALRDAVRRARIEVDEVRNAKKHDLLRRKPTP